MDNYRSGLFVGLHDFRVRDGAVCLSSLRPSQIDPGGAKASSDGPTTGKLNNKNIGLTGDTP